MLPQTLRIERLLLFFNNPKQKLLWLILVVRGKGNA